jgi:hypothetical protein
MGPIWDPYGHLNGSHLGCPYGPHMGSATGFQVGPIWQPLYSIWDSHGPHLGSPCTQYGPHMGPIWAAVVLNMGFKWAAQILHIYTDSQRRNCKPTPVAQ